MDRTLFSGFVDKFFRLVIGKITEKYNDKLKETPLLHKTMLTEEYSADLTWGATELNQSIVAADVVALDSALPLKKRGSLAVATGKLPKLGIKYKKGEKAISDINVMIARGTDEATVASKIFDDASKVIKAIDVRTEVLFLQGLSTGVILTSDDSNDGTGIRVDFGFKAENTFHCLGSEWSDAANSSPQDDLQQLFDKAAEDGNSIGHAYISKRYLDLFRKSAQGKLLAANYLNQVVTDASLLPVPSRNTFLDALNDEYGATFHIVDASFKYEKADGTTASIRPWEEANIVGVPAEQVGRLVYGTLAEETNPVANVAYQKSGTHILVSKYSKNDPLEEFTAGQSICLPVIDGVGGIYILHADAEAAFEVSPESLSFAKSGGSKKFEVHFDGGIEAVTVSKGASDTWITLAQNGEEVTVTATANTGAERTATVTCTAGTLTKTVSVTQAAGTN